MADFVQIGVQPAGPGIVRAAKPRAAVLWLQGVTLAWMLVEFGVSVYAAVTAHSPAMLAFGSDSLVELLSATVVVLQWIPGMSISERRASRAAGVLLFALAFVVAAIAVASLALRLRPETSRCGDRHHRCRADRHAGSGRAEAPRGPPQQECSPGRRCGAVGHLRLPCADHVGWPCGECGVPHRMVRFDGRAGSHSHPD